MKKKKPISKKLLSKNKSLTTKTSKKTPSSSIQFSLSQENAIRMGKSIREELIEIVDDACDQNSTNTYIYSPPGLGKTHAVETALNKRNLEFYTISGNLSMFAFGLKLAFIDHITPKNTKIVINIDDCDEILKNEQNINIIKSILEKPYIFRYEKSLTAFLSNCPPEQVEAINSHKIPNGVGFEVDCKNMKFIITSNKKLPTKADVEKKPTALNNHLHAIRSRCHTKDFNQPWEVIWGWIVDVTLNTKLEFAKDLSLDQKMILLDWMYQNWNRMNEASIRTVKKMAQKMINSPHKYKSSWEATYLNSNE
jgi:hypothetical protein